jgi:hypothetical protein
MKGRFETAPAGGGGGRTLRDRRQDMVLTEQDDAAGDRGREGQVD